MHNPNTLFIPDVFIYYIIFVAINSDHKILYVLREALNCRLLCSFWVHIGMHICGRHFRIGYMYLCTNNKHGHAGQSKTNTTHSIACCVCAHFLTILFIVIIFMRFFTQSLFLTFTQFFLVMVKCIFASRLSTEFRIC